MSEMNCNVILDLLELYCDGVVSEDTKALVEGHLYECGKCEEKLLRIRQNLSIPAETNPEPIKQIKRRIKKKNLIISLVSVFIVATILLGAFYYVSQHKVAIPFNKTHIYSVEQGDNDWEIRINYMDNIDEYQTFLKRIDDITMEYYIFFYDTYHTRYFSNRIATNSIISIPAYEGLKQSQGEGLINVQTVRIYYCIYTSGNGRRDFSERYLIWEKQH